MKPTTECWTIPTTHSKGYVETRQGGERILMHRFMYRSFVGPLITGMEINHLCETRNCIRPDHLEQVTHAQNVAYSANLKTHCPQGHEYTPENTYRPKNKARQCRRCRADKQLARYYAKKAAP